MEVMNEYEDKESPSKRSIKGILMMLSENVSMTNTISARDLW
jgi:hypothetical protein